jgi:hypothetical protein
VVVAGIRLLRSAVHLIVIMRIRVLLTSALVMTYMDFAV